MNMPTEISNQLFSERINQVPRSFIRDILKVATAPDIISFAGGLPNKKYFPVEEIKESTNAVLSANGQEALQYSNTEGLPELREHIVEHYKKQGLSVKSEQILITTGSQQALDLIGKIFINQGNTVLIEEPSYLGAIQAFSMYQPNFVPTELQSDGINTELFETNILKNSPKLAYLIPNFQNPTGISYSEEKRKEVGKIAQKHQLLLVEDDPYGLINFTGDACSSLYKYAPDNTIMLGTFSKSIAPGFRIGWIVAPTNEIYEKLVIAKQASDLHTDIFSQRIISQFLTQFGVENHLEKIKKAYKQQSEAMLEALEKHFPASTKITKPKGGMFCWVQLPEGLSSMKLFHQAINEKVAFVPGVPFYIDRKDSNTLRLNFSCSEPAEIREGIRKLSICVRNQSQLL